MAETSLGIKIAVDSGQVKTNLDKVQAEFSSASAKITKALQSIQGFTDLKKQTEETAKAYAEAQQKVVALAREVNAGAGGATLAKDFERAKSEAGRLKETLGSQQQQLQQVRTAMAAAGVSTINLAGQQAALRAQLDTTRQKYQDLAKVAAARDTLKLAPHAEITTEINSARAAYATLAASGKLSMAELAQAKVSLRERIDELTKHTNGWRDALGEIKGRGLEAVAAFGGIVVAARQAIAFETAMADVSKTVDGTKEQIGQLGSELRDMSFRVPLPVEELAAIAAAGGQLGVAAQEIGAFTDVTAKMATAFNMTAEAAGQAIGTMSNVWQLPVDDIELFGDAINHLGNSTAATEPKIVDVLLRIGGTARQFGLAKEQAAALAATMLSLGQSPEVASTSINALLVRMQTATKQSATFKEALNQIGMSAEGMADMVAASPQKAIDTLLATLSKLQGRERAEVLTGLFGTEYQDNISVLVGSLDTYQKALGLVSDQTQYAGAMNKEFETRVATTKSQLQLLWNVVTDIFKSIGSGFLPAIKGAAEALQAMLTPIAELVRLVPGLSAVLVSLGTGMLVYGTVTKLLGILKLAVVSAGGSAVASFGQASAAAAGFSGVLGSVSQGLAAFSVGWSIGTWLNQFDIVKKAGVSLAHVLTMGWLRVREAWAGMTGGDTAAVQREMDIARQAYVSMMKEIEGKAKQTAGVRVQEEKKVTTAVQQSAATIKQATGDALKEMQRKYQEYAQEVRRIQDDIVGRERSLAAELRTMARTGMTDASAWEDQKREAQEYATAAKRAAQEAKAAFASGDTIAAAEKWKEALSYADEAKQAYSGLNKEVKDGEQVVVSQQFALRTAMNGVKSSGELAISILKEQQTATHEAMNALTEKSGFANLAKGMDEAEQKWLDNWHNMRAKAVEELVVVEERIQKIVDKDRTVYINVKTVESRSAGGRIGGYRLGGVIQALAAGGSVRDILGGGNLPGFGGGDRVPLLGEAGEFMVNKWASLKAGLPALQLLNSGRIDLAIAELTKRLNGRVGYRLGGLVQNVTTPAVQRLATGGAVAVGGGQADFGTLTLSLPGSEPFPVETTRDSARRMVREFTRMAQRSSR
jgi:TP901 family phage tail tape measure protein